MMFWVRVGSVEKRVRVEEQGGRYAVEIDGRTRLVDCRTAGHHDELSLIIDDRSYLVESAPVKADEGAYYAKIAGRRYDLEIFDERLVAARGAGPRAKADGPFFLRSPMPGLIVEVRVRPGDRVTAGTTVAVMEAMKMRNELLSEVDGVVKAVKVKPRDTVESQALLVEIERT